MEQPIPLRHVIPLASALAALLSVAQAGSAPRMTGEGDGRLSRDEFRASRRALLLRADYDRDGRITRADWDRAAPRLRASLRAQGGPTPAKLWAQLDRNRDGVVTVDDIDAWTDARFEQLDANHDGYIDMDEARAALKAARR
jgi:hypothetical protein